MNFRILVAEDEDITRKLLLHALTREGYEAVAAHDGLEALELIEREFFDVLITDVKMPRMDGIELLEKVKAGYPGIEVLIITGFGSIDAAVEAMKKGAYEYITKPFNLDELLIKVRNIRERKLLKKENTAFKAYFGMNKGVSVIARSKSMLNILSVIEDIKDSDCNVLLIGETGVGKSLIGRIIHFTSRRQNMPFLSMGCATLTEELMSEELFGSEQAAVTGSVRLRQGLVEIADAGTLFLDEITEMPAVVQSRLLKVIEDSEFYRGNGSKPVRVNTRFISASHGDIKSHIAQGMFIEELYYRLNVMEIFIPPLREHKEDIEPLSAYFLQKHIPGTNQGITGFTKEAMDILMNYSYPGNIRELENIIERAVMIEKDSLIMPDSLPRSLKMFRIETFQPDRIKTIDELTREYAAKVVDLVEGDKIRAARLLGIPDLDLRRILKGK